MMNYENLDTWVDKHGLNDIADDEATPLHQLFTSEVPDTLVEFAGRHCYRSWEKGRDSKQYIENILDQRHGSVLEHSSISFAISGISRSCSHELVRHRAGFAWSQESQRYVDAKDMNFVIPPLFLDLGDEELIEDFKRSCQANLDYYIKTQKDLERVIAAKRADVKVHGKRKKRINETARASLPNAAETRLVMTCNLRALRHFLELRGGEGADAEIRRLSLYILPHVKEIFPLIFGDLEVPEDFITSKYPKV
jgi:thymidylate synthase (FAD)